MGRFFLSYSRADSEIALRLANDLRRAGAEIWVDQIDIKPSDHWDRSVERGLRESDGVLLVMSPRSVASENVMDEVSVALDAGKQIIPVLIEACQAPLRLARVQFIDATQNYQTALERCAAAMQAASPGAPAPVRAPIAFALLENLTARLVPILGPIASHVVDDEARSARDSADLIARLRERVPAVERDKFTASVRDLAS
jgi:hypothetical protein